MATATADLGRIDTYAAEDMIAEIIEDGGRYDFYGSTLDLKPDIRFGRVEDAQRLVSLIWDHEGTGPAPTVRTRRGKGKAHYAHGRHEIALPDSRWALTGMVVCHETSHALVGASATGEPPHGPTWKRTYAAVASKYLQPEIGLLLTDFLSD